MVCKDCSKFHCHNIELYNSRNTISYQTLSTVTPHFWIEKLFFRLHVLHSLAFGTPTRWSTEAWKANLEAAMQPSAMLKESRLGGRKKNIVSLI